jgi:poly(glycerol-phosphate) alpha-glucosyltransferase
VAILARLQPQKRLEDAIAAFAQVVEQIPDARLDIYGDGEEGERLQAEIDRRGIGDAVKLRGWDPRANDTLWTASATLLTSIYEGYPLSTLESLARGCPVVAYDIKYGPREQITDGVDGFLVPDGDVDALAARIIELLRDPDVVARMSAAALRTAESFGPDEFLAEWAKLLDAVVELRPRRTALDAVELEVTRVGRRRLAGVLRAQARTRKGKLAAARVELDLVEDDTASATPLPVRFEVADGELRFKARIRRPAEGQRLRLRLLWENSAWEADPLATR